ncbi:MAG: MgtC/SapB family protein [Methanobacterium sp.]|nr:MgtC/SapB family protein [Methanobacterium sp.]
MILKISIALAIGALIGTERERKQSQHAEFAGIRTFTLISLYGIISAYLSQLYSNFLILAFMGLIIIVGLSYYRSSTREEDIGITTEVVALVTFILGALCLSDQGLQIAPIIAIIITALLASKSYLHHFIRKISEKELLNTLKFLIIAFVILPLLPDQNMGPLGVFNPYQIWLIVVFISAISYSGYVAIKLIGPERGLGLTGIIGGLVSSTAVTTSMAARVKETELLIRIAVFATVIASSMMFFRILLEVMVINSSLIPLLLVPMLSMGISGVLLAYIAWRTTSEKKMDTDFKLQNPFSLKPALIFGLLFIAILFLSTIANNFFGSAGIYVTSLISGVADVDAITISMALLARDGVSPDVAVTAITLAAISNTFVKFLIALFFGTRKFGKYIGFIFAVMIALGIISVLFI